MGGNAIKSEKYLTKRANTIELLDTYKQLQDFLETFFFDNEIKFKIALAGKVKKESHGDADILIGVDKKYIKEIIIYLQKELMQKYNLEKMAFYANHNILSFAFPLQEKYFQVDLILTSLKDFDFNLEYLNGGDVLNFLGRITQQIIYRDDAYYLQYKLGMEGLTLLVKKDTEILKEYFLSNNITKILTMFDLNPEIYKNGFKSFQEMFEFIKKSKYFNPLLYDLSTRNHTDRMRDNKRPAYITFMKENEIYMKKLLDENLYKFDIDFDKNLFKINDYELIYSIFQKYINIEDINVKKVDLRNLLKSILKYKGNNFKEDVYQLVNNFVIKNNLTIDNEIFHELEKINKIYLIKNIIFNKNINNSEIKYIHNSEIKYIHNGVTKEEVFETLGEYMTKDILSVIEEKQKEEYFKTLFNASLVKELLNVDGKELGKIMIILKKELDLKDIICENELKYSDKFKNSLRNESYQEMIKDKIKEILISKLDVCLVGGAVRDELLGIANKDKDYIVLNTNKEYLEKLGFQQVGADFPVFLHPLTKEEYALPRIERKIKEGYTGFITETENVSLEDDLKRRDLTINAIAKANDIYIDPYSGQDDIKNKIIRHTSEAFSEDPLRILRVFRFQAKLPDFKIAHETNILIKNMINQGMLKTLTKERIFKEIEKVFKEQKPELFFEKLQEFSLIPSFFPELNKDIKDIFYFIKYSEIKNLEVILPLIVKDKENFEKLFQFKLPNSIKNNGKLYFETKELFNKIDGIILFKNYTEKNINNIYNLLKRINSKNYDILNNIYDTVNMSEKLTFSKQEFFKINEIFYSINLSESDIENLSINEIQKLKEDKIKVALTKYIQDTNKIQINLNLEM